MTEIIFFKSQWLATFIIRLDVAWLEKLFKISIPNTVLELIASVSHGSGNNLLSD